MERTDDLGGGYRLTQDTDQFCFGQDSVLLAKFAHLHPGDRVVDLCAGNGAISMLLCAQYPDITVTGVELQKPVCRLAMRNAVQNGLQDRLAFVCGDIRTIATLLPPAQTDAVVCNPPYRKPGSGRVNPSDTKAIARFELCMALDDVFSSAAHVLSPGGQLYLVHLPDRLCDCLCGMRAHGLEPKRVQFVHPAAGKAAAWVLIEAVYGGKPGLDCPAPIIICQEGVS